MFAVHRWPRSVWYHPACNITNISDFSCQTSADLQSCLCKCGDVCRDIFKISSRVKVLVMRLFRHCQKLLIWLLRPVPNFTGTPALNQREQTSLPLLRAVETQSNPDIYLNNVEVPNSTKASVSMATEPTLSHNPTRKNNFNIPTQLANCYSSEAFDTVPFPSQKRPLPKMLKVWFFPSISPASTH